MDNEIECFVSRANDSLSMLKRLSNLQILEVEQLNIGSWIDTTISFDPYTFEEIIQIYIHQQVFSANNILPNNEKKATSIRKKYHIRRLFAKELWQTLSPWKAIDRNRLLLQQLAGLKALKRLKISNNFLLDLKALVNTIAHHLPQLEVLQIEHCNIFDVPSNKTKLHY